MAKPSEVIVFTMELCWIIVLPTQRKEAPSQRFSNLALISVTWQQNTIHVEKRLPPECPKEGEAVISWALCSVPLLPPSVCQHTSWIPKYCFSQLSEMLNFEDSSVPACIHTKPQTRIKRKQLSACVCVRVCACVYIWRDLKEGEHILKNSLLLPNLLFLLFKNSRENNNNNNANTH